MRRTDGAAGHPPFEVRVAGRTLLLAPGQQVVVGRDALVDLPVEHARVSRRHLRLDHAGQHLLVADLGSSGGTWLDDEEIRGSRLLSLPVTLRLGQDGPELIADVGATPAAEPAPRPATHQALGQLGDTLVIGRAEGCDVRLVDDIMVSKQHAKVQLESGGPVVLDLGSRNGTFVNGQRVSRAPLGPRDELTVGRHTFTLRAGMLRPRVDDGRVTFAARDLGFTLPGGRHLLEDVSFTLPRSSLLAVVGPSGAGKSTLLAALTGAQAATDGQVLYNGRDLYERIEELRDRIGVVPQQDIVHGALTVRQALESAAELRFPVDLDPEAKAERVTEVIAELGLSAHADTRVSALSGGQRKRASVAMELLTKPSLLFLDEPTSGLDPGMDEQLMRTLRALADSGRTVIVITHSTASLELCDRLLFLAPGGRTAFFGPPEDALDSIGAPNFSRAFHQVEHEPDAVVTAFRSSMLHRTMVETPLSSLDAAPPPVPHEVASGPTRGDQQRTARNHVLALVRRQLRVMAADRAFVVMSLGMPLVVALLALLVPGDQGLAAAPEGVAPSGQPQQMLLVLTLGAVFIGLAASIRELVGERPIFVRERAVGLSPTAYLVSKVLVLGGSAVLQCLVMLGVVLLVREAPADGAVLPGTSGAGIELGLALSALTLCCTLLGLLISAALRTAAQVMPVIVVLVMTLLVLSGGLFALGDRQLLDMVSWLAPSRWGYAALAGTVDLTTIVPSADDELWTAGLLTLARSLLILAAGSVALGVAAVLRLRGSYPQR